MLSKPQQPENNTTQKVVRPLLVWIIFIYATISLSNLVSYYFIVSGDALLDGPAGEYYKTLNTVDHVFNVFAPIYFYICALQLFRLKANAFTLFLGYIPLMIALLTNNLFSPTWKVLIESEPLGYYSTVVNFVLYFTYAFYAYQLLKKGLLK